ncbi:MAG: hypothetical protein JW809_11505 [Pirellulales bacterium]|nr:hypothetical protein [Pirellulales bacterium]
MSKGTVPFPLTRRPGQSPRAASGWAWRLGLALLWFAIHATLGAAPAAAWHEGFEGQGITWRDAGGNSPYQIQLHQRVAGQAHTGRGSERLAVLAQGGTQVLFAHDAGRPLVTQGLRPTVWIRSDRSGLGVFAEVALPSTPDPRSGQPVRTLLAGATYTEVGRWQQLRLEGLPELLARQVEALRTQLGPEVDARGAYVERIVLNVYGGPGVTNVWIDDLEVAGSSANSTGETRGGTVATPLDANAPYTGTQATAATSSRRIELAGSGLLVDGQPTFLRAIQHQGESLATIKQLGFNAVWLNRPADERLLAEADREGLLVVCPPPVEMMTDPAGPLGAPRPQVGPAYAPVAAWDLGWGITEQDIENVRQRARQIRAADRAGGRPLVAHAEADLRGLSRHVDVVMVGQSPLATSLELSDYGTWIHERPRLARPGKTIWSTVQTEPSWALRQQWMVAGRGRSPPPLVGSEQIRLVAYTAIAAGSRGLLFESGSSLEGTDAATRARAAAVELLNLEIELIRPWVATGGLVETVSSNEPELGGTLFRYNRSQLLAPLWIGSGAQYVPGQSAGSVVTFTVPGVSDSARAYELAPGGLRPVRDSRRGLGGTQVTLEEFSLSSLVLFTEDPRVVDSLRGRAAATGPRAAALEQQLAARKREVVGEVGQFLSRSPAGAWKPENHLAAADRHLADCGAALAARDWAAARLEAQRATRRLRLVERAHWQAAVASLRSPMASPATVCFSTLPWHYSLVEEVRSWQLHPRGLPGGGFESIESVMAGGWRHYQHVVEGVEARADVIPEASHTGASGLRLLARSTQPDNSPTLVETPPIWITSPAVSVELGALVRIHGWVHVPTPITGSVDGLMIFDSMSGRALAERIGETTDWQPFTLYRFATQSGPMQVTFALAGLGEAWIDDVTIDVLAPIAPATAAQPAGAWPAR